MNTRLTQGLAVHLELVWLPIVRARWTEANDSEGRVESYFGLLVVTSVVTLGGLGAGSLIL